MNHSERIYESCHAIAAAIREAESCKETGEEKVILFNILFIILILITFVMPVRQGYIVNH